MCWDSEIIPLCLTRASSFARHIALHCRIMAIHHSTLRAANNVIRDAPQHEENNYVIVKVGPRGAGSSLFASRRRRRAGSLWGSSGRVLKLVGRRAHKRCKRVKFITFLVNNDCCCYKTAHSSVLQYLINGNKFILRPIIILMNLSIPPSTCGGVVVAVTSPQGSST